MHHAHELGAYDDWLRSWGASARTVEARIRLARHLDPAATTEDLTSWLARYDGWTKATYYAGARSWYGWLTTTGRIAADPTACLRPPRKPKPRPRPLTEAEVTAVLARADDRARAWFLLALLAGLRAHEIAKLRGEDVAEDFIFVEGKGGQRAFLPTHPDLWRLAAEYPRAGWWFPGREDGHISRRTVTNYSSRIFASVGVDGSIHRLRHTFATRLLRSGANVRIVQTLMRHESMTTTANYLGVAEDERRAAIGLLVAA